MSVRILVVDDDIERASTLVEHLRREGYVADSAHTGEATIEACLANLGPDFVILEHQLPDMAGTDLCRQLRQMPATSRLPIIVLSSRDEDIDRVVAFELGADDYVTRPFDERELSLRIKAILRRCYPESAAGRVFRAGPLRLNRDSRRAWLRDQELALTQTEFQLLEVLVSRRGRAQARERLLQDVWGRASQESSRTVDTHIRRLREKLGSEAASIRTIRGVGYCFGDESDSNS